MKEDMNNDPTRLTRRESLAKLGGVAATAFGATAWGLESAADSDSAAGPAGVTSGLVRCVLTPEQTAGPYFVEGDQVRQDIRAGRPGVPLTLRAVVLDVSTCRPIKGAAVDIWHCDALGVYSGVAAHNTVGKRFLRGIQRTNANGLAIFKTIYPGWYRGRTVHIHVRVYLGGSIVHTGQLYFPEKVTDAVYRRSPYRRRPNRDTRNATDFVYRNGGRRSLLSLRRNGKGYVGEITMGISR
jgi:protocatechuate 3,4-dioxygenase beta subunit